MLRLKCIARRDLSNACRYVLLAALCVVSSCGSDATSALKVQHVRTHRGSILDVDFGAVVVACGDINSDGVEDYFIGCPGSRSSANYPGRVEVYSGADGSQLKSQIGPSDARRFGESACVIDDVDGDGVNDWVIGAPASAEPVGEHVLSGTVYCVSAKSGRVLRCSADESRFAAVGTTVLPCGDIDGDGHVDVLVGAPGSWEDGSRSSAILAWSPHLGVTLYSIRGTPQDGLGKGIAVIADIDGDKVNDFVAIRSEAVVIYSGRAGDVIGDIRKGAGCCNIGKVVDQAATWAQRSPLVCFAEFSLDGLVSNCTVSVGDSTTRQRLWNYRCSGAWAAMFVGGGLESDRVYFIQGGLCSATAQGRTNAVPIEHYDSSPIWPIAHSADGDDRLAVAWEEYADLASGPVACGVDVYDARMVYAK